MLNTALPPGFIPQSTALVNTFTSHKSSNSLVKRHLVKNTFTTIQGVDIRSINWADTNKDQQDSMYSENCRASSDSKQVVDDAIWFVEPFAFKNGNNITVTCERLEIEAEEDSLKRILINLLSNAIQFSPAGSSIEVSVKAVQGFATFSVNDHGPGISADRISSIFQRNGKARTAGAAVGGGLGLSICKELVESLGGSIGVGSGESGSYFWFAVPLA